MAFFSFCMVLGPAACQSWDGLESYALNGLCWDNTTCIGAGGMGQFWLALFVSFLFFQVSFSNIFCWRCRFQSFWHMSFDLATKVSSNLYAHVFSTPQLIVMAQRNDGSDSSSESSPGAPGDFAGIGVSFGADGQMSVIHGMPGNCPSPQGLASMLMPMLANRVDYRVNKGKGGKGYSDSSFPPSGVVSMWMLWSMSTFLKVRLFPMKLVHPLLAILLLKIKAWKMEMRWMMKANHQRKARDPKKAKEGQGLPAKELVCKHKSCKG